MAELLGTLKGEDNENDASVYMTAKTYWDEAQYAELYQLFANESAALLLVPASDLESTYNLIMSIVKSADESNLADLITAIVTPIVESSSDYAQIKLKILGNIFNTLDFQKSVRCKVYSSILQAAKNFNELDVVAPSLDSVDKFISQWNISNEEVRELYLLIADVFEHSHPKQSYKFLLKYLKTMQSSDANQKKIAKPHAIRAIKLSLSLPEILNFESLVAVVDSIVLKNDKTYAQLVNCFLKEDLVSYTEFVKKNSDFCKKEGLNNDENMRKMRFLSLASLCAEHVQGEVSYNTVANALKIVEDDVEFWIIDVIRAGLIDAKMDQLNKTVLISRSTHRTFSKTEWQLLSGRIESWKQNLTSILQVIENAKTITMKTKESA